MKYTYQRLKLIHFHRSIIRNYIDIGKTLYLYLNLQKFGLQDKPLHWLGQVITMSPETPLPSLHGLE